MVFINLQPSLLFHLMKNLNGVMYCCVLKIRLWTLDIWGRLKAIVMSINSVILIHILNKLIYKQEILSILCVWLVKIEKVGVFETKPNVHILYRKRQINFVITTRRWKQKIKIKKAWMSYRSKTSTVIFCSKYWASRWFLVRVFYSNCYACPGARGSRCIGHILLLSPLTLIPLSSISCRPSDN